MRVRECETWGGGGVVLCLLLRQDKGLAPVVISCAPALGRMSGQDHEYKYRHGAKQEPTC